MGGKYDELRQAEAELASLDTEISRQERMAAGGKGRSMRATTRWMRCDLSGALSRSESAR
jgi:hypothetical protein